MITHRSSTLSLADTILHVEQGKVEERKHAEVLTNRAA
jgi:ABC-type multidrug transport system fused ATPase/permease subunit